MKYRFLYIFFLSIMTSCLMNAAQTNFPSAANLPPEFQMSEKDLTEMVNFLDGLSDKELKELEDLGKQVLTDMGYDAETLEPLDPNTPSLKDLYAQQQKPDETVPALAAPVLVAEPTVNTEELADYLKKFLKHLHSLQHKATSPVLEERRLTRWLPELRDLNFYITTIVHSEHLSRLQSKEYESLLKHLKEFGTLLIHHEPLFIIQEPVYDVTDDSYEILGITPRATHEEIEEAYQKIKAKKSPEAIKAQLTESGSTEKDIKRATKEAHLTMSLITDAYEKLQDPKTREQIDRERLAHTTSSGAMAKGAQKSLDALLTGISNAVYTQQLLNELEQFLKKYEPTKLEHRKALEQAEAARKKEQLEAAKLIPKKTPGGPFEPGVRTSQEAPAMPNYGNYGYDYPPYYPEYPGSYDQHPGMPSGSVGDKKDSRGGNDGKGAKKPGDQGKDGKGDDKGKDDKAGKSGDKGGDKRDDKDKKPKDKVAELFKAITEPFDKVHSLVNANRTETEINEALDALHKKAEDLTGSIKAFTKKMKDKEIKKQYGKKLSEFFTRHAKLEDRYQAKVSDLNEELQAKIAKMRTKSGALGETPADAAKLEDDISDLTDKKSFVHVMAQFNKLKGATQKKAAKAPTPPAAA